MVGKARKGGHYEDKSPARGGSQGQALDSGNAPSEGPYCKRFCRRLMAKILLIGPDKMAGSYKNVRACP